MHGFDPFCLGNGRVRFLLIMYAFSLFMEISFFHGLSVGMAVSGLASMINAVTASGTTLLGEGPA